MTEYMVTYASAGCLPDTEPDTFDSVWDAAEYIAAEWLNAFDMCSGTCGAQSDVARDIIKFATFPDDPVVEMKCMAAWIVRHGGIDDPADGSLYRWMIEQVTA